MTHKQRTKWFGWISAALLGISVMLAFLVGFDKDLLLGAFQMSMIAAAVINASFSVFAGFFAWFWRWMEGRDSTELTGLLGVKVGLVVFCLLMVISFGLKKFGKPPCYAPGAAVVAPVYAMEIGSVILEPLYIVYEATKALREYRERRKRERDRDWIDRQRRG